MTSPFPVTFFNSPGARFKDERSLNCDELAELIRYTEAPAKDLLPWLKLARFGAVPTAKGSLRHDSNVLAVSGCEGDYDAEAIGFDEACERLLKAGVRAIVYTSPSHDPERPRWRVLCPFSVPLSPVDRDLMMRRLNGVFEGAIADESFTLSQAYYFGHLAGCPEWRVEVVEGERIDLCEHLDITARGKSGRQGSSDGGNGEDAGLDLGELTRRIMSGEQLHPAAVRLIGRMVSDGFSREVVKEYFYNLFMGAAQERYQGRWPEMLRIIDWVFQKEEAKNDIPGMGTGSGGFHAPPPPGAGAGAGGGTGGPGAGSGAGAGAAGAAAPSRLVWFKDIHPIIDARDFVQNLLIERSFAVLYGESNSGKTFFATTCGLHIAAGLAIGARRVEQGGVIYCVLEGTTGFANRVSAWRGENGMVGAEIPFAAITYHVNMLDPKASIGLRNLVADCKEAAASITVPVKLIIIDTLSRALSGGNENSPEDMGALVMNTDRLRSATGAAVLYVHHTGKDTARGARGHSSLQAAVDTEIEVSDETLLRRAAVTKQRDLGKANNEVGFSLRTVEMGTNRFGEAVTTCVVDFSDAPARPPKAKMTGHPKRAFEILCEVVDASGAPDFEGVPYGVKSVPEDWWRDRFYEKGMVGADQGTKQRAFRRAADWLVNNYRVGVNKGRVWLA